MIDWFPIRLSFAVATAATLIALIAGSALAWLLARKSFPGRNLLDALVTLPLVLPPVVTGYALLLTFGRRGPIGSALEACCGIVFSFRWTGAASFSPAGGDYMVFIKDREGDERYQN